MDVRLNFVVEGQTEETFVNQVLRPHLADRRIWAYVRCVETSRKHGRKHRGGGRSYRLAKNDITRWLKEDGNPDARFTTMFDLYALPRDFPGYEAAGQVNDPRQRVAALESALKDDIDDWRFIPYLQLHEFEALLLADPQKMEVQFPGSDDGIRKLVEMASLFESPELIDDGRDTAPSKRISHTIPEYYGRKASAGPLVAGHIGLAALRSKCEHFGEWLNRLESVEQG